MRSDYIGEKFGEHGEYEVLQGIRMCESDYVIAFNPNESQKYSTWERVQDGFYAHYGKPQYYDSYLEAVMNIAYRMMETAREQFEFLGKKGWIDEPLTRDDCIEGSRTMNYQNEYVVLKASALLPEYQLPCYQVVKATGGFGCNPAARGTQVNCEGMISYESIAFTRGEIEGILDPQKMPDYLRDIITEYERTKRSLEPLR